MTACSRWYRMCIAHDCGLRKVAMYCPFGCAGSGNFDVKLPRRVLFAAVCSRTPAIPRLHPRKIEAAFVALIMNFLPAQHQKQAERSVYSMATCSNVPMHMAC
eukprot:101910-Pleurochrysis_carterae.AAC.3